jgi:hypothetical protein
MRWLFLSEFINTVLEDWGADTLTFCESTPFVSNSRVVPFLKIEIIQKHNYISEGITKCINIYLLIN